MTTISAKSILASVHALDPSKRIDTLLLRYPRVVHSEFMTHRMFSRNASSSRAIPVEKLIQDVLDDPFVPVYWGKNQKGMQADVETDANVKLKAFGFKRCNVDGELKYIAVPEQANFTNQAAWLRARDQAVTVAKAFSDAGYHKQLVNRLLEPFGHITVVVTSTNWSNFLALRDHKDAEPHIQILAQEVRKALEGAKVQTLQPGEWHMPWISDSEKYLFTFDALKKLSVARCASTSYKTVEGFYMTMERAEAIYHKLYTMKPIHASPFEHVAMADTQENDFGPTEFFEFKNETLGGNLGPGWIQLRKTLEGECL